MKKIKMISLILLVLIQVLASHNLVFAELGEEINIDVNIDTTIDRAPISPYIYGVNQDYVYDEDYENQTITAMRLGGNRLTGYNWENNYSSAGEDWNNSSDTYMLSAIGVPESQWNEPGAVVTTFQDQNIKNNIPYSIITLQAGGYVAADANGTVTENEVAPSERWKEVKFTKEGPLSLTPDKNDDYVYMDEFVNFFVNKYGNASTSTGIKGYSIDNEPSLWYLNHPRIHPDKVKCSEIIDKSASLAKVIKDIDPYSEVFGPALFGFGAFSNFVDAPDWDKVKGSYKWFIDYYLDNMKMASDKQGKRLLDVLDLHWYPEARGGNKRIVFETFDPDNIECNKARLQAPRTLWDSEYVEDSWIAKWNKWALPLIPTVKASIDKYNPGTKLAITEYSYGGENHITGGIAEADVLGIFGKHGVYLSNFWKCEDDSSYVKSAIDLYRNYDGKGSKYGDTKVKCGTSDVENSSVYASIIDSKDDKVHIIVLNKNYDNAATFNFNINSDSSYNSGRVWAFDSSSSSITEREAISNISGNKFSYTLPALTACHIVLEGNQSEILYGDLNGDKSINSTDLALMKKHLLGVEELIGDRLKAADMNKDGKVNSIDIALLKKYLLIEP